MQLYIFRYASKMLIICINWADGSEKFQWKIKLWIIFTKLRRNLCELFISFQDNVVYKKPKEIAMHLSHAFITTQKATNALNSTMVAAEVTIITSWRRKNVKKLVKNKTLNKSSWFEIVHCFSLSWKSLTENCIILLRFRKKCI